jgi:hypothetical protein
MLIIGIDPGLQGGMSVIPVYAFNQTKTYPLAKFQLSDISQLLKDVRSGDSGFEPDTVVYPYIEEPSLNPYLPGTACRICKKRPMRNSQSFAKLGRSLGQLEGVFIANGYIPTMVPPNKWQTYLGCQTKGDKNITKCLAIKVFPFLTRKLRGTGEDKSTITHAVADSLLIALYGYLQYATPRYIPKSVTTNITLPNPVLLKAKKT